MRGRLRRPQTCGAQKRGEAPSPSLRSTSPRTRGEVEKQSRSRNALSRASAVTPAMRSHGRFRSSHRSSSEHAGGGHWHPHDQCLEPRNVSVRRKRKAERRRTLFTKTTAPSGAARALQGALAHRRSTTALARGTPVPKAQLQARLPGTWFQRVLSVVSCPSPVTAPHAPVVMPASMMPEAARE